MPLLECGRIVRDSWQKLADDAALPSAPCILSLSRLQQDEAVRTAPHLRLGVALPVDQPAEVLAPYLDRLSLVAVNFPTFRDGRAFTQACSLRERLAFRHEIRATGNILPDQYAFLLRCGSLPSRRRMAPTRKHGGKPPATSTSAISPRFSKSRSSPAYVA
jgi:uncharacterized protein (DUF934 family)